MFDLNIGKLARAGTAALCAMKPDGSTLEPGLARLLAVRNGFFAFDDALHVFPSGLAQAGYSLEQWNAPELWTSEYGSLADDLFFFAETVLGEQFALHSSNVVRFDPETGNFDKFASSVDRWAARILRDPNVEVGCGLARQWQYQVRRLKPHERLVPKMPFVLGGDYGIENLGALDAAEGMGFRGSLARQIKDLPDGATVKFEFSP